MKREFDVLVVGELNMDLILADILNFPEKGKEILANEMTLTLGSSSAIFASNLSSLGTKVRFIGKIGKDQFGKQAQRYLLRKNIDINMLLFSDTAKTGLTVALSYGDERAMITHAGAMKELKEKDISDEALKSCRHLHVSSIFLQPALKQGLVPLFRRAKKAGMTTSMDTQWDPDEKWDCDWEHLLPLVDIFLPNKQEILGITGENESKAAIDIIKDYVHTLVIKNGRKGSKAWKEGENCQQSAFLNNKVKDAIGAGDSFDAGYIHYFLQNKPIQECLAFGSLCGAINTTAYGGTTGFNSKEEIKKTALNQFNFKINDL